jgi:hypothetical protein
MYPGDGQQSNDVLETDFLRTQSDLSLQNWLTPSRPEGARDRLPEEKRKTDEEEKNQAPF